MPRGIWLEPVPGDLGEEERFGAPPRREPRQPAQQDPRRPQPPSGDVTAIPDACIAGTVAAARERRVTRYRSHAFSDSEVEVLERWWSISRSKPAKLRAPRAIAPPRRSAD
jgi:hypothetical protein